MEKDAKKVRAGRLGGLKAAEVNRKNGTGIWGITPEQRKEMTHNLHSQKWMSLVSGLISNPGAVARHNAYLKEPKDARVLLTKEEYGCLIKLPMDKRLAKFEGMR